MIRLPVPWHSANIQATDMRRAFYNYNYMPPLGPGKVSARERVLAEWRGLNVAPLEKASASTSKPLSALVPKALAGLRMDTRQSEAEVVKVWNQALDPLIVAHAQPVGLRKGTLFVNVDNSAWLQEILVYRKREIMERLRHSFGPELIRKISFRLG
jgi:predicted nucleic acid-binding Zn ribbon protein